MHGNFFEANLAALRTDNPHAADAAAGMAAAMDAQNAAWHPAPGFDAPALTRSLNPDPLDILLALGFGDGTWLQEFADAAPQCDLHVFEMFPQRLARALRGADLSRLFTSGRFYVFTGAQAVNEFGNHFYQSYMSRLMKRIFREPEKNRLVEFKQHILSTNSPQESSGYQGLMQQLAPYIQNLKLMNVLYSNIKTHAADLAEYLEQDLETMAPSILNAKQILANDWKASNPSDKRQIHEWYCKTPNYLLELCAYHANSPTYPVIADFLEKECTRIGGRILDFGGGDGDMTLRLARRGLNVEYCDVPGKTMAFAQWRFNKHGFDIPCIASVDPDTVKLQGLYNAIICMDVLEHLVDPMHYCEILYQHLPPLGVLFTRPSFSHDELHPMHLAENVKYQETFDAAMQRIGFQQRHISQSETFMLSAWVKTGDGE